MAGTVQLPVIEAPAGQVPTATALPYAGDELLRPGREQVRALSDATDQLFGFAEKQKAVQDTIDIAKAHVAAGRELDQARVALDGDPDFKTKADRFRQTSDQIRAKYSKQFGGAASASFEADFDRVASGMEMSVRHDARRDEVQQGRAALDDSNTELVGKAAFARNDVERDGYLNQVKSNLDNAVATGIVPAQMRKAAEHQYLGRFDETLAMRAVRTDPAGAIAQLGDPAKFPFLDPVKREALRTAAQTRLETLGATARLEARSDAADMITGFHDGVMPDQYDQRLAQVKAVAPKVAARVEAASRTYQTLVTFNAKPLPEQADLLKQQDAKATDNGMSGEERAAYLAQRQNYARALTRWSQDPFTEAVNTNTVVKELFDKAAATAPAEDPKPAAAARDAALQWQQQNGVPANMLSVIGSGQAKALAQELAGLSGTQFNDRIGQLKQQYGDAHFAILRRQLAAEQKGAGKITSMDTALELPDTPNGITARANLIDAGKIADADLHKLFPKDEELKATRQGVEDALTDLRASLGGTPGGMSTLSRYVDDSTRLAAAFQMQGLSRDKAVERAVQQLVGNHYTFVDGGNGGKVRVPNTIDSQLVDMRAVRGNLAALRESLDGGVLAVPPGDAGSDAKANAANFAGRVKEYGRWVTEQGGRSAILAYEANGRLQPVLKKDGKPIVVDFLAPAPKEAPFVPPPAGIQ